MLQCDKKHQQVDGSRLADNALCQLLTYLRTTRQGRLSYTVCVDGARCRL